MRETKIGRIKSVHPYEWIWEPLEADASFVLRAMFGAKAVYLGGKLVLCFIAKAEPWRGLLVCTEKKYHESLVKEFPSLSAHPVLSKWLYLPEPVDDFEHVAGRLVALVRNRDGRIGVMPQPRKSKRA
jgi:hypothetical protein